MEEDGKVFSDYDVDMSSGRTWFEGVKLFESGTQVNPPVTVGTNNVYKIELLNNNKFFSKDYGEEFRA